MNPEEPAGTMQVRELPDTLPRLRHNLGRCSTATLPSRTAVCQTCKWIRLLSAIFIPRASKLFVQPGLRNEPRNAICNGKHGASCTPSRSLNCAFLFCQQRPDRHRQVTSPGKTQWRSSPHDAPVDRTPLPNVGFRRSYQPACASSCRWCMNRTAEAGCLGGLAHDLNNLLNLQTLLQPVSRGEIRTTQSR